MFFKNIQDWSNKKLKILYVLFNLMYYFVSLICPMTIIFWKYQVFSTKTTAITGFGIIVLLVFFILGLKNLNKLVEKMPDTTQKQQKIKYFLQMIYALIMPIILILCLFLLNSNFNLAYETLKYCISFVIFSIFIDYFFLKFIDKERYFRVQAQEKVEIRKREKFTK